MMTSQLGGLLITRHGRTVDLRCSTVYTDSDVYAALVRRGARPIEAEAMIHGLIQITKGK